MSNARSLYELISLQRKADQELARKREADKAARSYDTLFSNMENDEEEEEQAHRKSVRELEEDFM
jgi:hypothetical protein